MKRVTSWLVAAVLVVFGFVCVAQAATPDDAKALAEKAAAFYKANGKEKAIAEFNNPTGQFVKGDLYVVLQGFDGVLLANGGNQKIVGQNHLELKDPNGKFFVKEMVDVAKKGGGWVTYAWTNPSTKKVQPKKSWIQKADGADIMINCGVFQ
jgi:cytochrome c